MTLQLPPRRRSAAVAERHGRRSRPWRWVGWLALAAAVFVVGVVAVTAFRVWHVGRIDQRPSSDAIVVLGASQFDGRPSEVFAARLDHARTLYDENVAPRIVTVGGGRPGDRFTEAAAGARYLERHGVPHSALVPVGIGGDTVSSLRGAKEEFAQRGWHSAVLVTDPWHSLRSRTIARDLGLTAHTSPVHTGPVVQGRGTEIRYIGRETVAYLAYELFGGGSGPRAV